MSTPSKEPVGRLYLGTVLLLMLILPVLSILAEHFTAKEMPPVGMALAGKWFLFWTVGLRLLTAGLRQAIKPAFTAEDIFHIRDKTSFVIVRELGFANICLGSIAAASLAFPGWRMAAATAGGLFFGIAGVNHCIKKPVSPNEWIALISDLFVFLIMLGYVCTRWPGV